MCDLPSIQALGCSSCLRFCPFYIWLFGFYFWLLRVLYIYLDINPFTGIGFAKPVTCLCNIIFQSRNFLFWCSPIYRFFFCELCFWCLPANSLPNPKPQKFPLMFSSRSFTVSGFTFRSVIHFELLFLCGTKYESVLVFSSWICNYSNNICQKDYPFSIEFWLFWPHWWLLFKKNLWRWSFHQQRSLLSYHLLQLIIDKRET